MPRKLNKNEFDQEVYNLWMSRLAHFGLKQAKKIVWEAYKILRDKERQMEKKYGKTKSKRRDKESNT